MSDLVNSQIDVTGISVLGGRHFPQLKLLCTLFVLRMGTVFQPKREGSHVRKRMNPRVFDLCPD